jgi:hypothetical protein
MEKLLTRIEKLLRYRGIPSIHIYIVTGQVLLYFFTLSRPDALQWFVLSKYHIIHGELWRLLTFVFIPPTVDLLWAILSWYFFYSISEILENQWGTCRLNIYLALGYLASIVAVFVGGHQVADNTFFLSSTFLAYATLYPDCLFMLFFIIPVKAKYFAIYVGLMYLAICFTGGITSAITIFFGSLNYIVFFGPTLFKSIHYKSKTLRSSSKSFDHKQPTILHKCTICGITENDNPNVEFRYCTKCSDSPCFCLNHLKDHKNLFHK